MLLGLDFEVKKIQAFLSTLFTALNPEEEEKNNLVS